MPKTVKLFCNEWVIVDGKYEKRTTEVLRVWAAVNTSTGEVDMDDLKTSDPALEHFPLFTPWEWREFHLVPAKCT